VNIELSAGDTIGTATNPLYIWLTGGSVVAQASSDSDIHLVEIGGQTLGSTPQPTPSPAPQAGPPTSPTPTSPIVPSPVAVPMTGPLGTRVIVEARFRTVARWPHYSLSFALRDVLVRDGAPTAAPHKAKHLKGFAQGTLRVGITTHAGAGSSPSSVPALRNHVTWFVDDANRGVLTVIQRSSSGGRAGFGGILSNGPITAPGVMLGAINGDLQLKGGGIRAKGGLVNSTPADVGADVASALVFESFIRDSTRGSTLSVPRNQKGLVVTGGSITFVMDEGSSANGNDSSITGLLSAAAVDAILAEGDGEPPSAQKTP
jgi:hypothetical protein